MNLTHKDVQEIVALLNASAFDELIVETPAFKLILRRGGAGWTQQHETRGAEAAPAAAPKAKAGAVKLAPGEIAVSAPLPGTFYRAPKPGADPFVDVGATVTPDTVVAIIETMKLMTPVHAGAAGTVSDICVANAAFIERDTILMKLKT